MHSNAKILLLVFDQCLRNTRRYAKRPSEWLPPFSYLFDDIFREIVSVLCLHNPIIVNLHDRGGLSKPRNHITIRLPLESSDFHANSARFAWGTDLRRLSGLKERLGQPGELIEIHGPNHPHLVMMSSGEDSPAERERSSGSLALGERQQLGEDGTFCHIGS